VQVQQVDGPVAEKCHGVQEARVLPVDLRPDNSAQATLGSG